MLLYVLFLVVMFLMVCKDLNESKEKTEKKAESRKESDYDLLVYKNDSYINK